MSLWSAIDHFFKSVFGKDSDIAQKVLHDASSFVQLAEPIVTEIDTDLKPAAAANPSGTVAAVENFLTKYESDLARVKTAASSFAALPAADLWRNVAQFALQAVAPKGVASSLLNLAIELAYSISKSKRSVNASAPAA
ncbi:MAG TPA: hypothetical protein VKX25_19325 [Bryobacteraceae bacterium]|jgi:hypothetical protein|nr:hypothetical protein [Bryobacteraceae bacterium]